MPKLRRCAVEFRATPARRAREVWSEEGGYKSVAIGHTVDKTSLNSLMVVTVEKIEKETNYRALRKWKEPHPQEEAVGYFIAKVDVWDRNKTAAKKAASHAALAGAVGFGLYQIYYT